MRNDHDPNDILLLPVKSTDEKDGTHKTLTQETQENGEEIKYVKQFNDRYEYKKEESEEIESEEEFDEDNKKEEKFEFICEDVSTDRCFAMYGQSHHTDEREIETDESASLDESLDLIPTDTYGHIEFQGSFCRNRAKFLRLIDDTDPNNLFKWIKPDWKFDKFPSLLLSFTTGGQKDFSINKKLELCLQKGLKKIVENSRVWLTTGGTDTGVTSLISNTIEGKRLDNVHLIGIATWGVIIGRESLQNSAYDEEFVKYPPKENILLLEKLKSKKFNLDLEKQYARQHSEKGSLLDKNHTHFLLVDSGIDDKYGGELEFRRRFEKHIITQLNKQVAPAVQIVIGGGISTLKQVGECLRQNSQGPIMPIIVVKGSGHAAELLTLAHSLNINRNNSIYPMVGVADEVLLKHKIEILFPAVSTKKSQAAFHEILFIMEKNEYITIFDYEEETCLENAILLALMKGATEDDSDDTKESLHVSKIAQLNLAMSWNQVDIARKEIFRDYSFKGSRDTALEDVMGNALIKGKREFVELFLDNGFDINMFLSYERLGWLYYKSYMEKDSLLNLFVSKTQLKRVILVADHYVLGDQKKTDYKAGKTQYDMMRLQKHMNLDLVKQGIKNLIGMEIVPHYWNQGYMPNQRFLHPFSELFIWAVLSNKHSLALCFWPRGDESIVKAVIGCKLYQELARKYKKNAYGVQEETLQQLQQNALEFGDLAGNLLAECALSNKKFTYKFLRYPLKRWGNHDCMSLAVTCGLEDFIAQSCCQDVIMRKWNGGMYLAGENQTIQVIFGLFCYPFISRKVKTRRHTIDKKRLDSQSHDPFEVGSKNCRHGDETTIQHELKKLNLFFKAPVTSFWSYFLSYILFIGLFSYVVICEISETVGTAEMFVVMYIISLTFEEIRQICQAPHCLHYILKVQKWWSYHWNKFDFLAITTFFLGFGLRMSNSRDCIAAAQVIYSINAMLWILRLLDVFAWSQVLGPYIVMMQKMLVELFYFIVIFLVFLFSYGVARYAILQPDKKFTFTSLRQLIGIPYFQMYGELFVDIPAETNQTSFGTPIRNKYSESVVLIIMAVYLILGNILLINLLIAVFNNTYQLVQINSNRIWRYQRYHLVEEFNNRPSLPPPLIFISHIIALFKWVHSYVNKPLKDYVLEDLTNEYYDLMREEKECLTNYMYKKEALLYESQDRKLEMLIKGRSDHLEEVLKETSLEIANLKAKMFKMSQNMDMRLQRIEKLNDPQKKSVYSPYSPLRKITMQANNNTLLRKRRIKNQLVKLSAAARDKIGEVELAKHANVSPLVELNEQARSTISMPSSEGRPSLTPTQNWIPSVPSDGQTDNKDNTEKHGEKKKPHTLSRSTTYPQSQVERLFLADHLVPWEVSHPNYKPHEYTAPLVLAGLEWADKPFDIENPPRFNDIDEAYNCDRRSFSGEYKFDPETHLPRNPAGRTGMSGRGMLGRYGPNHIVEAIFTRSSVVKDENVNKDFIFLQVLLIETSPGEYQLPAGPPKLPNDYLPKVVNKLFSSTTLRNLGIKRRVDNIMNIFQEHLAMGRVVSKCYLDDERNTDNAWIETTASNFHIADVENTLAKFLIYDEQKKVLNLKWINLNENTPLFDHQMLYLENIATYYGAVYEDLGETEYI